MIYALHYQCCRLIIIYQVQSPKLLQNPLSQKKLSNKQAMTTNIDIDSVNNMAFNSVNRLTSTIRSTLEKGSMFIRPQNPQKVKPSQSIPTPHIQPTSQDINALELFTLIKPFTDKQQKQKSTLINILNFAELKWQQFTSLQHKSAQHYHEYLQKFKKIQSKLNKCLSRFAQQDCIQQIHAIKAQFKRVIEYLNQRARKHVDKSSQMASLIRKQDQAFEQKCQQAIKQQMLELLDRLKGQALNMGSDLKKDNSVISQIHEKQDRQLSVLSNKSKGLQEMISGQKLGFFKLISYAGIGIVVWIFTLLFILIF